MLYRIAVLMLMTITTYAQKKPEEGVIIIVNGSAYEGIIFSKPKVFVKQLGASAKPTEFFTPSLKEIEKMEQNVMLHLPQLYRKFMQEQKNNRSIDADPAAQLRKT